MTIPTWQSQEQVQVPNIAPPVTSGIFGAIANIAQVGVDKAAQQAQVDAYKDGQTQQAAIKDGSMAQGPDGWAVSEATSTAFQKGAMLTKQSQLQLSWTDTVNNLQNQYRLDPAGFQKAAQQAQTDLVKNNNIPTEYLPAVNDMLQTQAQKSYLDIQNAKVSNDLDTQKATTQQNLDSLENQYLQVVRLEGPISPNAIKLSGQMTEMRNGMVTARLISPEEGMKQANDQLFNAASANASREMALAPDKAKFIAHITDPDGDYASFGPVKQQQLAAGLIAEDNLQKQGMAGDRLAYSNQLQALESNLQNGDNPDLDLDAMKAKMVALGYPNEQVQSTLDHFASLKRISTSVNLQKSMTLSDQSTNAAQAAVAAKTVTDPVARQEADLKANALASSYDQNQKAAAIDHGWTYIEQQDPTFKDRYDTGTQAGRDAAEAEIKAKTGIAQPDALDANRIAGLKNAMAGAQNYQDKENILHAIAQAYPQSYPDIIQLMGLGPSEKFAAVTPDAAAAGTVLVAAQNTAETAKLMKAELQQPAFDKAYPPSTFNDPQQRKEINSVYDSVTGYYMSQGQNQAQAQASAGTLIGKTYKTVSIDGNQMFVPQSFDQKAVNDAFTSIAQNASAHTFLLASKDANGNTVPQPILNSEVQTAINSGKIRITQDSKSGNYAIVLPSGEGLYVASPSGTANQVMITPDGKIPAFDFNKQTTPAVNSAWGGSVVKVDPVMDTTNATTVGSKAGAVNLPAHSEMDFRRTAFLAGMQAKADKQPLDTYIGQVSNDPGTQVRLQGVSAAIKGGDLPDWAIKTLGTTEDYAALNNPGVAAAISKAWSKNTDQTMSPLQKLKVMIDQSTNGPAGVTSGPAWRGNNLGGTYNNPANLTVPDYSPINYAVPELGSDGARSLVQNIAYHESGGDYTADNGGHVGKYQMSPIALVDDGLIDPDKYREARRQGQSNADILNDDSNWTIKGGKSAFLADPQIQEDAMQGYTSRNASRLKRMGVITDNSSPKQIAGYLAVAHLLGAVGAKKWKDTGEGADENHTTGQQYFNVGQGAIGI